VSVPSNGPTLREYVTEWQRQHERMHDEHQSAHDREHEMTATAMSKAEIAVDKALNAALEANNKRFDSVNEFRQSLSDAAARFATRDTLQALERSLTDRIDQRANASAERLDRLEKAQANFAGRVWALGAALGFGIVILQFVVPFLR
jgi:exonuclease VII large subunit